MLGTVPRPYLTFIEPAAMFAGLSIQIAMFALIGGLGTVAGSAAGAALWCRSPNGRARRWGHSPWSVHGFVLWPGADPGRAVHANGIMGALKRFMGKPQKLTETEGKRSSRTPPPRRRRRWSGQRGGADLRRPGRHRSGPSARRGLNKHFGGLYVTRDVSFTLREGEVLGLIGPERRRQDHAFST